MKKTVIITGVSKGLGEAMAKKFLKKGHDVVGFSRTKPQFELSLFVQGDINHEQDRLDLIEKTIAKYGKIDLLINNAGMGIYTTWEEMKMEDLRRVFELNVFSVIALTQLAIPHLKKTRGTLANLCSVAGKISLPYMGGYCASKFAIDAFSTSLRAELKEYGIKVLNIVPGRVETGFGSRALGGKNHPSSPSSNSKSFAKKIYRAYLKNKKEIVFPGWYKIAMRIIKLIPGFFSSITLKKWKEKNI